MNKTLHINGNSITLESLTQQQGEVRFAINGTTYHFRGSKQPDGTSLLEREIAPDIWQRQPVSITPQARNMRVEIGGLYATVSEQSQASAQHHSAAPLSPLAPMPGVVRKLFVGPGDEVKSGQPIAVMEAMKLQLTLTAGGDATVDKVNVAEGDMIAEGSELVKLKAKGAA